MIRTATLAATFALALGGFSTGAMAAQCKDAKGKFTKCPTVAAAPAPAARCKDAKGKFAKCGTAGAVPIK